MPSDIPRIITKKELRLMVPYTPQHVARLEKAGRFPKRIAIGPRRVAWRLSDIEAWLNERAAAGALAGVTDETS